MLNALPYTNPDNRRRHEPAISGGQFGFDEPLLIGRHRSVNRKVQGSSPCPGVNRWTGDSVFGLWRLTQLVRGALGTWMRDTVAWTACSARLSNHEPEIFDAVATRGGLAWYLDRDDHKANSMIDEALAIAQEAGDIDGVRIGLAKKGTVAFGVADYESAAAFWAEALRLFWANLWPSRSLLDSIARVAIVKNEPAIALRLAGAADAFRVNVPRGATRVVGWTGPNIPPGEYQELDAIAGGDAKSHPDWVAGHAMSAEEAVKLALAMAGTRSELSGVDC